MNFPTSIFPGLSLPVPRVRRVDFLRSADAPPLRERMDAWRRRAAERKAASAKAPAAAGKGRP